jgi:uncharacterized protein
MSVGSAAIELGNEHYSDAEIASALSPKLQQLIILPTEKCNFRCTYCYEDFAIGKMKEPVQRGLERFMDRRVPELAELSISWFGGEPLVARDVVLRLSRHASRLCAEHGTVLRGGLTTNGYLLTKELFEELVAYDQRFFQITLDGWKGVHDEVRRLGNRGGTFERIWENLLATRSSSQAFDILVRIHVRRDNQESLRTLVENIARAFGRDPRYKLDFEHLRDLGGDGGKSVDRPISLVELREIERDLRRHHEAVLAEGDTVTAMPDPALIKASDPGSPQAITAPIASPTICYASKPNSLLIRADGRIGKCTVALTDDRNTIGSINADGTVTIDNARLRPWVRGLNDLDIKTLACPLGGLPSVAGVPA